MLLVTLANNLALMWIAIEATTIVSALLIGLGFSKRSLAIEAAWKYIILCTVGITFALLGIFITYYATISVMGGEGVLNWTTLRSIAPKLNPATMKLAFIFILVGYGTKAGLAPVHNWLPDAHSEAPSPISALLSGILLNTAFYGIMRFVSITDPSTGSAFTGNLLILFGLISMGVSSVFILIQVNYKRLLAYSSIEHMGIISLGMGIGGRCRRLRRAPSYHEPCGLEAADVFCLRQNTGELRLDKNRERQRGAFEDASAGNADVHRGIITRRHAAFQYLHKRIYCSESNCG